MSFFEILSTLLIGPLRLVFEIIYLFAFKFVGHYGLSIIILSLAMNFLLLPLYRRTDTIQEQARDTEEKLRDGVEHIKKNFSGDERMMILQTYYRQNNYKPTDALNGSISLLLEVPFFMAAYQFLSNLNLLHGESLGPITDLGAPDGLLVIGGLVVNLLPVIMTVVNFISSALYLNGFPMKTKIQLYAMALFFLVFLYESPSGLVLYWTMNNLFSLAKTLFYKLKNPKKVASHGAYVSGLGVVFYALVAYRGESVKVRFFLLGMGLLMQMPLILALLPSRVNLKKIRITTNPDYKMFLLGVLFLAMLTGLLIPSTYIAASPQEYVDLSYFHNPLWYCVSAGCLAAGTFCVWMGVFYWLANDSGKVFFDKLVWILCGIMTVNYMFFGTDLGIISASLKYEHTMLFTQTEQMINLLVLFAAVVFLYLFVLRWNKAATTILLAAVIALGSMSAINIVKINTSVKRLENQNSGRLEAQPHFELSKTGKNVVVIMLDRGMGTYVPYMMQERPELKEQFEGFTYYSNVVSFGGATNFGSPPIFGGYEYTPVEMNKRSSESLAAKHTEALKVMPVLFYENGYKVTVCDPPYANYQWSPDLSIYDDYPGIDTYITEWNPSTGWNRADVQHKEALIRNNRRNFFCFSIMKTMPLVIQPTIYNDGRYNATEVIKNTEGISMEQNISNLSVAHGQSYYFMESYSVLENLSVMARTTDDNINTFMFLCNNTPHVPVLLQTPDYFPANNVDNTVYDTQHSDRFTVDGRKLVVETEQQMMHYHANMAALIQLGNWFDYLKDNGVYDNTRIILVADHGYGLGQLEELRVDNGNGEIVNLDRYFPLLMVKDFAASGFTISDEFMTNADVPSMAMEHLIDNPVNPFTGVEINTGEKGAHEQLIITSKEYDVDVNNGTAFLPSGWVSVKEDIWNKDNWKFHLTDTVLTEHKLP